VLHFKAGVGLKKLQPQLVLGIMLMKDILAKTCGPTVDCVITSCNDGEHMQGSFHYSGKAADFRTQHTGMAKSFAEEARKELGPLGFDVILEDLGQPNEHLHLEYDPKT